MKLIVFTLLALGLHGASTSYANSDILGTWKFAGGACADGSDLSAAAQEGIQQFVDLQFTRTFSVDKATMELKMIDMMDGTDGICDVQARLEFVLDEARGQFTLQAVKVAEGSGEENPTVTDGCGTSTQAFTKFFLSEVYTDDVVAFSYAIEGNELAITQPPGYFLEPFFFQCSGDVQEIEIFNRVAE